jgi:hypothetical protein
VVVFGGEGSSEGTLVYDPYTNTWEWMKPPTQPDFRSGGNMTYDVAHHRHILFGSQFGKDPGTWAYEYPKTWRDLKPATQPPADKNDAVLAYDQASEKVLAIIKISEGKDEEAKHTLQTWAYDGETNTWERMNPTREPDPSGNRARVLIAAPDRNLLFLEDCPSKPREQQIWSYRVQKEEKGIHSLSFPLRTTPRTPEDVVVSVVSAREVAVSWKPPPKAQDQGVHIDEISSYVVERARVEVWTEDQLWRLKSRTPSLEDPSVGAISAVGPFTRISKESVKGTSFVDREVTLDKTGGVIGHPLWHRTMSKEELDGTGKSYRYDVYAYRIRAVGQGGESGPSEAVFTIPSMPQWVFSKEEGGTCHLKWAANPEKDVKGYRVYRMDGRFDKEPITRLTPDPIPGTAFSDPAAGKSSRRYYIVAVDALGQEGHPSTPVWHDREWKPYYKPFTGEWHQ